MTTAIEEGRINREDFDVYRYFEGGREGVQTRIGEAVRQKLPRLSDSYLDELCKCHKIKNIVEEIKGGNYTHVCRHIFTYFSLPLEISVSEVVGNPQYDPEQKSRLVEFMDRDGFRTTYPHDAAASRLREFLISKAWVDLNECHHEPPEKMDPARIQKCREKFRPRLESIQS